MSRPRGSLVLFTLVTVLAVVLCVLAARWQWHRAHRTVAEAVPDVPAVAWTDFDPRTSYSGMRLAVTGRFAAEQVLVTPRTRQGRPGAWVYTALRPDSDPATDAGPGLPAAIGVLRGWVPEGTAPQDLAPPSGPVTVTGILVADERRPGPAPTRGTTTAPRVDSGLLAAATGLPVRAGWLALTAVSPDAPGQPVPLEVSELPGADVGLNWRNAAYALQWLVFAGFAVFFWNRFRRDYFTAPHGLPGGAEQEATQR